MNREQIAERVIAIISAAADVSAEEITLQSDLMADISISSLKIIMMLAELENAFGVQIPTEDLFMVTVVDDLVNCVQKQLEAKS